MDDLIEFELEMLGAGPRSGCRVLQADSGLTTLRLLSPWLAGEPVPGRASVVVEVQARRLSDLQPPMPGQLPAACREVVARPVAVARDVAAAAGLQLPQIGPGPGPADGELDLAKQRQKNMHLSPNTKKRKATANSYANLSAARAHPASLITKLIGAPAVAAGVPPLDQIVATCCKRTCLKKVSFPQAACIMAVGGYSHLQKLHVAELEGSRLLVR